MKDLKKLKSEIAKVERQRKAANSWLASHGFKTENTDWTKEEVCGL